MIFFLDIDGVMVHANPHKHVELDNVKQHLNHRFTRKDQVLSQIVRQGLQTDEIIIIDDDKSLNELPQALKSRLVLTSSYIGLNEKDLPKLKTILNR